MQLELTREVNSVRGCEGALAIDSAFECYTLEPPEGIQDARGITAVPPGTYKIVPAFSPHLDHAAPQLLGVPGRSHILIHWGNYESCTKGCILVGQNRDEHYDVWYSRAAFDHLFAQILRADDAGEAIHITILPAPPPAVEV